MTNMDPLLLFLPVIFLSCTGIYYIVAATMLEQVVILGRASVEIKQLTNRKDRLPIFFSGLFCITLSVLLAELFTGGKLLKAISLLL